MSLPVEFVGAVSRLNSISVALAPREVFVGEMVDTTQPTVRVTITATGRGQLSVDAGGDVTRFDVEPGRCEYVVPLDEPANILVIFENGATAQATFELTTEFGAYIEANR